MWRLGRERFALSFLAIKVVLMRVGAEAIPERFAQGLYRFSAPQSSNAVNAHQASIPEIQSVPLAAALATGNSSFPRG
jgi:hypothetical protein